MKHLKLILLIIVSLLVMPLISAHNSPTIPLIIGANGMAKLDGNYTFEGADIGGNWSPADAVTSAGNFYEDGGAQSENFIIHRLFNISNDGNWSMEMNFRLNSIGNSEVIIRMVDANESAGQPKTEYLNLMRDESNVIGIKDIGSLYCNFGIEDAVWHQLKYDFLDNRSIDVYVDTVYKCNAPIATTPADFTYIWMNYYDGSSFDFYMDNLTFYNCTGSGALCSYPADAEAPPIVVIINNTKPNITIDYPSNGNILNNNSIYPFIINGTTQIQNGTVSSIVINSTEWRNDGNTTYFNFTFNGTFVDLTEWYLNITAISNHGNQTSAFVSFKFDVTSPTFQSNINNNYTLTYAYNPNNFTFNINFSDNNQVYSFNVSTTEGFAFAKTDVNTTKYIYYGSINVSTYGIGEHTLRAWTCDTHTRNLIDDYSIEKDIVGMKLTYGIKGNNVGIKLKSATATLNNFNTYKNNDRYIFWFDFNEIEDGTLYTYTFKIDAAKLKHISNSGYPAHFVANDKNWIDFDFGDNNAVYTIKQTEQNNYEVKIQTTKTSLNFKSIGDLNCVYKDYKYYVYNYTAYYTSSVIETTSDIITLQLDFADIVLNGTAQLIYDGITYGGLTNATSPGQWNFSIDFNIPSVSGNITNITFLFALDLNNTIYSPFNTPTNWTQVVSRIQVLLCGGTLTNVAILNISFYNEESPLTLLPTSTQSLFQVWTNDSTNFLNFTFNIVGQTNYSICMYPNTTLHINSQMTYNSSGGYIQRWFLRNGKLTSNTTLLSIYGTPVRTGYDDLRGTLRTTAFALYPGIYTSLQRFYTGENAWRTVQKDLSDDYGQVNFNIIESSTDYRLLFFRDYTLIDQTNSLKFLCDTNNVCNVNFVVEVSTTSTTPDLVISSAYNNNSQIYQLNWTDGTGLTSSVRLWLTQQTGTGSNTICDTTVSSSSGTINCDTTGYGGTLKAQIYSAASPSLPKLVETITKAIDKLFQTGALNFLETGFWGYGIVATLTIGAAIYSIMLALFMLVFGIIVLYYLGLVKFVTMTFIMILIVLVSVVAFLVRRER